MPHNRLQLLTQAVQGADTVLILPHNNPDSDVIASAVALCGLLAKRLGLKSPIAYRGLIGRAENRALVRYLGHRLHSMAAPGRLQPDTLALVDTQPGAGNITLPLGARLSIVIGHHTWREETSASAFAGVRPQLGATSTILVEYLQTSGVEPTPKLATALFYGIKTATMGLGRDASPADAATYSYLQPRIDDQALANTGHAQVPPDYFRSFDTTLCAARVCDGAIIAYIGVMTYPDLGAEMADVLFRLERTRRVICIGACDGNLTISVRTRRSAHEAEHLVQAIVGSKAPPAGMARQPVDRSA